MRQVRARSTIDAWRRRCRLGIEWRGLRARWAEAGMRQFGIRRFERAMSVLALVALLLGIIGSDLARAQEATPVAGVQPTPIPTGPATLVSTPAPSASPAATATSVAATPAPKARALGAQASVVPSIAATNFSPASSTFSNPQGYTTATMTATITLSASGDVTAIAPWQLTIQGDAARMIVAPIPNGLAYMDFDRLSFQGLVSPATGVTADDVGTSLSNDTSAALLIAHGDHTGFISGSPNTLSFGITLMASPGWTNLPGTYSGGLILAISAAPPSAP